MTLTNLYTSTGATSLTTNAGSATVLPSPSANSLVSDLVVIVVYCAANPTGVKDAGDGWVVLELGWNGTFGMFMAATIQSKHGGSNAFGLTLPSSMAWTCVPCAYTIGRGMGKWDLSKATGSTGWYNATASATTLTPPSIVQPSTHCIDIYGVGYNNGGTTTTCTPPTGYTERNDTGQISPAHGVSLGDRTAQITGWRANGTLSGASLAVAKTNRGVMRVMIPIMAASMHFFRYGGYRRHG